MLRKNVLKLMVSALFVTSAAGLTVSASSVPQKPSSAASNTITEGVREKKYKNFISEDADSVTIRDKRDKEVTLKKKPKRVVCAFNSYLDLWYEAGGSVIAKVTESEDKLVPESDGAETIGSATTLSLEKVLSLEPDLVILSPSLKAHQEMADQLEEAGVSVLLVDSKKFEDYLFVADVCLTLNEREDLYKPLIEDVVKEKEDILSKIPMDRKPKIAIFYASQKDVKLRTSMDGTGEMLKDLNTENIADVIEDKNIVPFSMEKVIEEDPDFIFVQLTGSDKKAIEETLKKETEEKEEFATLKAVKNGNYILLPKDLYLYKPNSRYPEAYRGLAGILYPDVFPMTIEPVTFND